MRREKTVFISFIEYVHKQKLSAKSSLWHSIFRMSMYWRAKLEGHWRRLQMWKRIREVERAARDDDNNDDDDEKRARDRDTFLFFLSRY